MNTYEHVKVRSSSSNKTVKLRNHSCSAYDKDDKGKSTAEDSIYQSFL